MKINRRQAVRSALFTVAALSQCKGLTTFALAQEDSSASIDPRQTLFQPMEATTLAVMDLYFPNYMTNPKLQILLPYTAFIKNGGKHPVKAYEMKWVENANKVDTTLFSTLFVSRPSTGRRSAIGTGWNTIVRPGEYAVVTPLFLWSATKYNRHVGNIPLEKLMMTQTGAASFIGSADPTKTYRVRRATKICRHTAIGTPSSMTSEFEASVNLEREMAAALVSAAQTPNGLSNAVSELLSGVGPTDDNSETQVKRRYLKSVQVRGKFWGADVAWAGILQIASRSQLTLSQQSRVHVYKPKA